MPLAGKSIYHRGIEIRDKYIKNNGDNGLCH